jgi:hypothetical protein
MQKINQVQKNIYNIYIKYFRQGLPYKKRKNFDSIDEKTLIDLQKLEMFFKKHPYINIHCFFEAPSVVYKDKKYPNISFFNSRVAIKAYSIFNKIKENQNPENQFEDIKKSLIFIGSFCIKNNIDLSEYLNFNHGLIPAWLNHYREKHINIYSLMELGNIISILDECEPDLIYFIDQNLKNNIAKFKIRYMASPKTISFVKECTKRIKIFVKNSCKTPNNC